MARRKRKKVKIIVQLYVEAYEDSDTGSDVKQALAEAIAEWYADDVRAYQRKQAGEQKPYLLPYQSGQVRMVGEQPFYTEPRTSRPGFLSVHWDFDY